MFYFCKISEANGVAKCQTEEGWPVGMGVFIVLLYFSIHLKGIIITDHVSAFPHLARTLVLVNLGTRYFWWSGQCINSLAVGSIVIAQSLNNTQGRIQMCLSFQAHTFSDCALCLS